MGAGNLTDDFISDKALSDLINSLSTKKHPIDLILNGDTFDFLKCPSKLKPEPIYIRHITKNISLDKLKLIHKAHKQVFDSLKVFLKSKNKEIYFTIGNHDYDLFFPEVQEEIKKILNNKNKVHFPGLEYNYNGVHVEHGQQYDLLNKINPKYLFLNYKEEPILNLASISFGIISSLITIKHEHPFLERIKPLPTLLTLHRNLKKQLSKKSIIYLIKSILYYPLRYYDDPTYHFPRDLFNEAYVRLKNANFEVPEVVDLFKEEKNKDIKKNKVYVFGHVHKKYIEETKHWVIIHPSTWRDEYIIDSNTRIVKAAPKHYVSIKIVSNKIKWNLIKYPIKRSILHFNDIIENELKFIKLAAKEEGYKQK